MVSSFRKSHAFQVLVLIMWYMCWWTENNFLNPGGISESNAAQVLRQTGVTELHGSVRGILKKSVHVLPGDQNTIVWTVDSVKVQKIVSSCNIAAAVDSSDQNIEKRDQYLTS